MLTPVSLSVLAETEFAAVQRAGASVPSPMC